MPPAPTARSAVPPLRTHQARALEALESVWDGGRERAWVVLPPGAGKTRVGLETVVDAFTERGLSHAVVLAPNTAIQGQWVAAARDFGLEAGTSRDLGAQVTCLTYQAVAVFDPDAEVDDDAGEPPTGGPEDEGLLDRLHPNGRALVENMRDTAGLLLVLDECHHLLEVWGRLLGELLDTVAGARVLGLTATPPDALTTEQAELVKSLFSDIAFRAGVPAVVKEGDLAPFAELAWLTTPTSHETEWLASEATRWQELVTYLTDPTFGSVPFLEWLRARFVAPVPGVRSWAELAKAEPVLCDAALRLCHAGLLELPVGARLQEQHRRDPDADDWVVLLDDWVTTHLVPSTDPRDEAVLAAVRAALPSVGYLLTRRGVRRGRTPVDRVLARSEAKTTAAVEIISHELSNLGARTRMLVLCDHERASATLPTGLDGVIDAQSGSAYATLEALVADPTTTALSPLLVTGATVAAAPETLVALTRWVEQQRPDLAGKLVVTGDGPVAELTGPWSSRSWVAPITSFFEAGHSQVLVGTRGLLGEGWDARSITGLVDLTTATTLTAVVQTRGRALRVDPSWAEKVAVNWSVVCVSDAHPKGANDWGRLVRKHQGFYGVDDGGDIVDGVSHIDAGFSPYAPPPVAAFEEINARMVLRSETRQEIRDRWRVGEPYRDTVAPTVRVTSSVSAPSPEQSPGGVSRLMLSPPTLVPVADGIDIRDPSLQPPDTVSWRDAVAGSAALAGAASLVASPLLGWYAAAGLVGVGAGATGIRRLRRERVRVLTDWVTSQVRAAAATPSVGRVAACVAESLHAAGLTSVGVGAVVVEVHPGGEHRCRIDAPESEGALFAVALEEALDAVGTPRYVVSRFVLTGAVSAKRPNSAAGALRSLRESRPDGVVWHPVPTVLGTNASRAGAFHSAWQRWVGEGSLLYTGSPEGAGALAAQSGADPFDATTVLRRHWL